MRPLEGIRIVDLTRLLPGGFCTMMLADLGAEVIKVERPGDGDYARDLLPGMYYVTNRNKKSIGLDLKRAEGREVLYRLVAQSDVVLESFRPGVAERLGAGYEQLRAVKPNIIYGSITGYGQHSPYRLRPGHDLNYLATAGALSIPARLDHPPERSGLPVADLCAAMYAALAVLAAIIHRAATGRGQYLDVSMTDAVLAWTAPRFGDYMVSGIEPGPDDWWNVMAANDVFETADGKKIALGVVEDVFWQALCRALGREDLAADPRFARHEDRQRRENARWIHGFLREELRKRPQAEWLEVFDRYGVPASPVAGPAEVFSDPHFLERGMIGQVFVPQLGRWVKQVAFPVIMSDVDAEVRGNYTQPPALGQHTDEVLGALGYDAAAREQLRRDGVIA